MTDLFIATNQGGRDREVVEYLNNLFLYAVTNGISDIHFESAASDWNIRVRSQGQLQEILRVRGDVGREIATKIRARAKMELADRGAPMDGRFSLVYADKQIGVDVRVSVVSTERGFTIVCRVLDQRNATRDFDSIMMPAEVRSCIKTLIDEPDGLFLVTGPTGSGKTSTLYSIIGELNTPTRKILTIEDPVEYRVDGLQQIPITQNNSFAMALRASLRQDPDVILLGEIRDAETARIAVSAASTGHLVLSTLHTNDASSSIMRMLDLGVDAFTLGSCLRGVLAQRLVKAITGNKTFVAPTTQERLWMASHGVRDLDSSVAIPVSEKDLSGRAPVMELIMVDPSIRRAMAQNDEKAIQSVARRQPQYKSLAEAGIDMARAGLTSLKEVRSITSSLAGFSSRRLIGEILIQEGRITERQLVKALETQISMKTNGEQKLIGEILVEMNYCSKEDVNECIKLQ